MATSLNSDVMITVVTWCSPSHKVWESQTSTQFCGSSPGAHGPFCRLVVFKTKKNILRMVDVASWVHARVCTIPVSILLVYWIDHTKGNAIIKRLCQFSVLVAREYNYHNEHFDCKHWQRPAKSVWSVKDNFLKPWKVKEAEIHG